jgi:hypothetical protein
MERKPPPTDLVHLNAVPAELYACGQARADKLVYWRDTQALAKHP